MIIPNVDNTGNLCEKENIRKWVYSVLKKKATTFVTLLYIKKVDICCFYVKMSIYLCSEKKLCKLSRIWFSDFLICIFWDHNIKTLFWI